MISKTIFSVASSRLISAAVTFITSLFLIRELSVIEYGELFFLISLVTFFTTLPNVGINNYFVYSSESEKVDVWIYTKLVIFVGYILAAIPLFIFLDSGAMYAVLIGLIFSLFDSVLTVYQAQQKFKIYSVLLPAKNVVLLMLLFVFSKNYLDIGLLNAYLVTAVVFTIPFIYSLFKYFPPQKFFSADLIKGAKGFFLFELFALIIIRSETWIIKFFDSLSMIDVKALGLYGIVFGLCSGLSILSNSIQSVLLPRVRKAPDILYGNGLKKLYVYSVLVSILYYFSINIFLFFYKEDVFSFSLIPSSFIIIGMCASFIASLLRLRLVNCGMDKALNVVYVTQLLLTFLFGSVFILFGGAVGAAVSFALVRVFGLIFMTNLTRDKYAV
ncbi:hypothetical protein [Aeromonas salmonicida]|uniref:hypothetical protein n=1 Tax=Aeromonas salmonicida TaxID=645 RepID=UPI00370D7CA1